MTGEPVLIARDADDLTVISARYQDATVRRSDMAYTQRSRRFAMLANRFMHERPHGWFRKSWRVRAGLHFDAIDRVETTGLPEDAKAVLVLLSVTLEEAAPVTTTPESSEDGAAGPLDARILLTFAGGAQIRLHGEALEAQARDIGAPWPASRRPDHS